MNIPSVACAMSVRKRSSLLSQNIISSTSATKANVREIERVQSGRRDEDVADDGQHDDRGADCERNCVATLAAAVLHEARAIDVCEVACVQEPEGDDPQADCRLS